MWCCLLKLDMNLRYIKHADYWSISLRVFKATHFRWAQARGVTLTAAIEACPPYQENPRYGAQSRQAVTSSGDIIQWTKVMQIMSSQRLPTMPGFANRSKQLWGCMAAQLESSSLCLPPLQLLSPVLPSEKMGLKINPQLRLLTLGPLRP